MSVEGEQVAKTQKQGEHTEERSFEPRPKNTTKLQIKALPYGTTKEDLTDLCRRYGQIVAIEAKGTQGFVTFFKGDEAQLAIHKLDGMNLLFDFSIFSSRFFCHYFLFFRNCLQRIHLKSRLC